MKALLNVIGVVLIPVGAVVFLQGLNVIHMGFMAGRHRWILVGALLIILGIIVLTATNKKKPA
ncbi:MAG: hypothetical protein ACLQMF_18275 [Rectinemataceae bacterium]